MRYIIGGVLLLMLVALARASVPTCAITGNITKLAGYPASNAKVFFITGELQNPGGTIIPGGERVMVMTDVNGNLPTAGGCLPSGTQFCPPQSSYFFVQVGSGPTSRALQAPLMSTVDIDQLVIENNDPVSVVTDVQSTNSNCTTTNPGTGVAGTSTITCGIPGGFNPIIDVRNYGCHGDINPQPGQTPVAVVATNGSSTLSSGADPWSSGDVGKLINIFDETKFYEVFSGTITGFSNSGNITLSGSPVVTNGDAFQAEWATSDDTCVTNINNAIKAANGLGGFFIAQFVPMAISQPWVMAEMNGVFQGIGCSKTPIIWFGATPDQDMLSVAGSINTTYRNLCLVGGSYAPPRSGIQFRQRPGLGDTPNISNHLIDVSVGVPTPFSSIPQDNGQGFVATPNADIAANATTITLASPPPFSGPGPDQVLEIVDTSNGAVEGNELVMTSHTYVRGASPIALVHGPNRAHTAANTVILIAQSPINTCYFWDNQSTQDDKNVVDHSGCRFADVAFNSGQGNSTGVYVHGSNANGTLVGLYTLGGGFHLDAMEWEAVGVRYAVGSNTTTQVDTDNGPSVAGGGSYGPGYVFTQKGGVLELIDIPGFPNLSIFTCSHCGIDLVNQLNANNDIINTGIGQSENIRFLNAKFTFDFNSIITPPIFPSIHTYAGALTRDVVFEYNPSGTNYAHAVVTDPGFASNTAYRRYRLCREPSTISDGAVPCSDIIYRGSEAASDAMGELDSSGLIKDWGAADIKKLDATQSLLAVSCTGGSGGATDYWYRYAWSVSDGEGHTLLQKANTTGSKVTCLNAPAPSTPINVTAYPVRGGMVLHLYGASCADPCSDPGTEAEVATQTVGNTPSSSFGLNTIQDIGNAPGAAMPTADATGLLTVGGLIHRTPLTVATLPTTCNSGDTAAVSDWNATNGVCTGGGSTPVVATCNGANAWYCP